MSMARRVGYGAVEALGIHPGPIEAARASLPLGEHVAGGLDPLHASRGPLGGRDPVNEIPARGGSDIRPNLPRRLPSLRRRKRLELVPGVFVLADILRPNPRSLVGLPVASHLIRPAYHVQVG